MNQARSLRERGRSAIDRFQSDKSDPSVIVFSAIKRCQLPYSTQFFKKPTRTRKKPRGEAVARESAEGANSKSHMEGKETEKKCYILMPGLSNYFRVFGCSFFGQALSVFSEFPFSLFSFCRT